MIWQFPAPPPRLKCVLHCLTGRIYTETTELASVMKQHYKNYMLIDVHKWSYSENVCVTAVPMFERSGREVKSVLGRERYLWICHMLVENKVG